MRQDRCGFFTLFEVLIEQLQAIARRRVEPLTCDANGDAANNMLSCPVPDTFCFANCLHGLAEWIVDVECLFRITRVLKARNFCPVLGLTVHKNRGGCCFEQFDQSSYDILRCYPRLSHCTERRSPLGHSNRIVRKVNETRRDRWCFSPPIRSLFRAGIAWVHSCRASPERVRRLSGWRASSTVRELG